MEEKKKNIAVTALRYGSGVEAAARVVKELKEPAGRVRSLFAALKKRTDETANHGLNAEMHTYKYVVFSPFYYQYGIIENGKFIPDPGGTTRDSNEIPDGKKWYKGAYFGGDNFGEMIDKIFESKELEEMITGASTRKFFLLAGAAFIVLLAAVFAIFGKWYGIASLPVAFALVCFALKNGVLVARLRDKEMMGLSGYFKKYGFFRWMFL